jgi:hypothetical protein
MSQAKWGVAVEPRPIVREFCPEVPRRWVGQVFNQDFAIEFFDRLLAWPESAATAASILPNTLGAELFLTVEKGTLSPMVLELIGGDALRPKHFSGLIEDVDTAVRDAVRLNEHREHAAPGSRLIDCASMCNAAFVRLLVVGTDITFLYFPRTSVPAARGQCLNLVRRDNREIDCYVDGEECVCFDGWIRTELTTSERVLVSLRER